jgi:excisionase family DNA binding protein
MQLNEIEGTDDDLVSISEAARQLRLNKSTLSRQIKAKRIRSHGGKVRISEVRADRSANIPIQIGRNTRNNSRNEFNDSLVACTMQYSSCTNDDEPIGPRPFTCITEIPLTRWLVRQLAELIQCEAPDDTAMVGEYLISIGADIMVQETERLKTEVAALKAKGN